MANYRQAPQLVHVGEKASKDTTVKLMIPMDIAIIFCNALSGKNGNAVKLLMFFIGTIGDGSFKVSESWIKHVSGMEKTAYINARKTLVELGWIKVEKGKISLDFDEIRRYKLPNLEPIQSELSTCDDTPNKIEVTTNDNGGNNKENRGHDKDALGCGVMPHNRDIIDINNKEIITEVVLNLYNKLGNEYNIQIENIRTRIEKKLSALNRVNIDMYDFLDFWINIISDLKENRFDKNIAQSSVIEYDLSTALNKYDSAHNVDFKSGYKIYKTDILDIYDQEKYDKIVLCIKDAYYEFKEDSLWWFNNESKKAYKISTFMRYRNLKEYKYVKKPKKEYDYESQY